jgi:hypothetical protein
MFQGKAEIDRGSSCRWLYNQKRVTHWSVVWSSDWLLCFFIDDGCSRDDEGHFTLSVFIRTLLSCRLITFVIHIHVFTATTRVRPHVEGIRAQNNTFRCLTIALYHLYVHILFERWLRASVWLLTDIPRERLKYELLSSMRLVTNFEFISAIVSRLKRSTSRRSCLRSDRLSSCFLVQFTHQCY